MVYPDVLRDALACWQIVIVGLHRDAVGVAYQHLGSVTESDDFVFTAFIYRYVLQRDAQVAYDDVFFALDVDAYTVEEAFVVLTDECLVGTQLNDFAVCRSDGVFGTLCRDVSVGSVNVCRDTGIYFTIDNDDVRRCLIFG